MKRNKKRNIIIAIITILLIILAIWGGIKLSQNIFNQEQAKKESNAQQSEQESNAQQSEQEPNTQPNNQEQKENIQQVAEEAKTLTKEQWEALSNIYNSEEKRVFLTFDDGPSYSVTPKILDILKQENIKATFFVLGTMVKSNPEILKRERQEGHYIANHGYSHIYKNLYKNEKSTLEEYQKTNEIIQNALNEPNYQCNVFRFPGGSAGGNYEKVKTNARKLFKQNNIAYLDWNALTNDSAGVDTKEEIMQNLKSTCKEKNSIVLLMHDAPNKDITAETLPDVINYLRKQGYTFKSLYDIL